MQCSTSALPSSCLRGEPAHRQEIDWQRGAPVDRKFGECLSQHRHEFEPVPRQSRCEHHVGVVRMLIHNKVLIRRHRVHTHGMIRHRARYSGQILCEKTPHAPLFFCVLPAVNVQRILYYTATGMLGTLYSAHRLMETHRTHPPASHTETPACYCPRRIADHWPRTKTMIFAVP